MNAIKQSNQTLSDIYVVFEPAKLELLIREEKLLASDFKCLDTFSKKSVWKILLTAAANRFRVTS